MRRLTNPPTRIILEFLEKIEKHRKYLLLFVKDDEESQGK